MIENRLENVRKICYYKEDISVNLFYFQSLQIKTKQRCVL